MADFKRRQLEIGLEFVRWSFAERNNLSEGSSKPNKDLQVIRVRVAAAPRVFELELLVFFRRTFPYISSWMYVLYVYWYLTLTMRVCDV